MKAQAAVYDGIMLLLITTFSIALLYTYVGDYGTSQFESVQTAHFLNYMQSMMKAIYTTDVSQLADAGTVTDQERTLYGDFSCADLSVYRGTNVADLMKKDLSDGAALLDDKFGTVPSPGSLAARCYMKEVMKPYSTGGYKYLLEVYGPREPVFGPRYGPDRSTLVTNSPQFRNSPGLSCDDISTVTGGATVSIASTPFRVLNVDPATGTTQVRDFILKLCLWPSKEEN